MIMKDYYNLLGIDPALKGAELENKLAELKKEASRRATQASSITKRLEAQQRLQLLEEATVELLKGKENAGATPGKPSGKSSSIIYGKIFKNPAPPENKPIRLTDESPKPVKEEDRKAAMPLRKVEDERIAEILERSRKAATVENVTPPPVQAPLEELKESGLFRKAEAPAFHKAYSGIWGAIWSGVGLLVLLAVLTPVFYKEAAEISYMLNKLLVQNKYLVYAAFLLSNIFCWTRLSDTGLNKKLASSAMGLTGFLCFFMLLYPIHESLAALYGSSKFWNIAVLILLWACVITAAGVGIAVAGHRPTGFFALIYIALYEIVHYIVFIKLSYEATITVQLVTYAIPSLAINTFDNLLMLVSPFNYIGRKSETITVNRWIGGAINAFREMPVFVIISIIVVRMILNAAFGLVYKEYNAYVRLIQLPSAYKAGILAVFLLLAAINYFCRIPNVLGKLYWIVFVSTGAAVHYIALAGLYFYSYRYYTGGLFDVSLYILISFSILALPVIMVALLTAAKEYTAYVLVYLAGLIGIQYVLFDIKNMPASGYIYFVALVIPIFPAWLASRLLKGKTGTDTAKNKKYRKAL
jgi:hypothetical protein